MPALYAKQELSAQEIFRAVSPSVYLVVAAHSYDGLKEGGSLGSAVAISTDQALTNCHVIEDHDLIALIDGDELLKAVVSLAHKESDRCYLRVERKLKPIAAVRRTQELSIGERVYTIGNPSGLTRTLGEGIISGLRVKNGISFVQTTAQISRGSSGGALVDSRGTLVGITTFLLRDAQNLNFAIAAEEYWR
jgi:S1-C subfamily serine protease